MSKSFRFIWYCLLILFMCSSGRVLARTFDLEEIQVTPSPAEEKQLELKRTEKVLDFDVAKDGPRVAILILDDTGACKVTFWDLSSQGNLSSWTAPKGFNGGALAWSPTGKSFFLAGKQGGQYAILRVDREGDSWNETDIYRTPRKIRRLIPAPRPFVVETSYSGDEVKEKRAYRVFFGLENRDGTYAINSITEDGKREYQVIGSRKGFTTFKGEEEQPSRLDAVSALPLAFHPAGHILLWQDGSKDFHYAVYARDNWKQSEPLSYPEVEGGSLTPTPNGLALIHWRPDVPGVSVISRRGGKTDRQAVQYTFLSTPSSVPDGKGIVGLIRNADGLRLTYTPIRVPLADVANAWMFADEGEDQELFERKGGLLRDLPEDQLYSMYESEAYQCGGYDRSVPTRPYMVTTDLFWELQAAAYEGLFIVRERCEAMPAFWQFVEEADRHLQQTMPNSHWARVFATLKSMRNSPDESEISESVEEDEVQRIRNAAGREFSPVLGAEADYGELKPRGHYNSNEEMKTYFMAFKYITQLAGDILPSDDLKKLPPEVKSRALAWIGAYSGFIAPSRAPVVWSDAQFSAPPYAKYSLKHRKLFPLAWGADNEILLSTVYHADWPEAEQVKGPSGLRLSPSGLDVAAALGSEFAVALLESEFQNYPPLRKTIMELRARIAGTVKGAGGDRSIYDRWLAALALQWADDAASPGGSGDLDLWRAKRLQTGLASWATLRHATVLVNERTAAECGEAAFEPILMTPPRGYVEPDPRTFEAIAAVFDAMGSMVGSWAPAPAGSIPVDEAGEREAFQQGVQRRLSETADKARLFKKIAEKEIAGETLTDQEYEEILNVGRIAEHHFLIFKSLASEEYALSNPDPMPKIADVAGGGPFDVPFLLSAVGRPMEWDHISPYFGRRQIAKGAVYSYYQFLSDKLMTDKDWLQDLPFRPHPDWISPFLSRSAPACPPQNPF